MNITHCTDFGDLRADVFFSSNVSSVDIACRRIVWIRIISSFLLLAKKGNYLHVAVCLMIVLCLFSYFRVKSGTHE